MSDHETNHGSAGGGFRWRHRFTVLGVAVIVVAVVVAVFLVIKDADEPSRGDRADQAAVEAVYNQYANAVQSSDPASAGICADRSEPKGKLTQTAGMIGGLGTAGSTIHVNIEAITVEDGVANVNGSLNTMGTNVPLPLELRKIDTAWCVWN